MTQIHIDPDVGFKELIKVRIDDPEPSFQAAQDLARSAARAVNKNAMLLAWHDTLTGRSFPDHDCGGRASPPWMVFAEARGGNLTVEVNDGDYVFIFLKM